MDPVQDNHPINLSAETLTAPRERPVFTRLFSESGPNCEGGDCPAVYSVSDSTDVLVQGYALGNDRSSLSIPTSEDVVRIPRALVDKIVAAVKAGTL